VKNRQVLLINRPTEVAQADDFKIVETDPDPLPQGSFRVVNHFLSVDPAMRGWIADEGNYASPVPLGSVMRSLAAGEVVESKHPDFAVGTLLSGWFGWQEQCVVTPDAVVRRITEADLPLSLSLGILGINGVTAHLALTTIGQPIAGETVLVSTAAGAVGSAVGQIANLLGCRTIGVAGGKRKCNLCVDQFGFAAAIDYKQPDLEYAIRAVSPAGVDVYFDNVAGPISDAVYPNLALNARIIVCGTASIATWKPWPSGPRVERYLLTKRARMQGFVIFDHHTEYLASVAQLATWVREGKLHYREDILDGIKACPGALAGLYRGENEGKRLIRL
jgi:NADPH-dependent curcumin reductase CurA